MRRRPHRWRPARWRSAPAPRHPERPRPPATRGRGPRPRAPRPPRRGSGCAGARELRRSRPPRSPARASSRRPSRRAGSRARDTSSRSATECRSRPAPATAPAVVGRRAPGRGPAGDTRRRRPAVQHLPAQRRRAPTGNDHRRTRPPGTATCRRAEASSAPPRPTGATAATTAPDRDPPGVRLPSRRAHRRRLRLPIRVIGTHRGGSMRNLAGRLRRHQPHLNISVTVVALGRGGLRWSST